MEYAYAYAAFWGFCTVAVICYSLPKIIRAFSEVRCVHKWDLVREGDLVDDIGEPDEKRVGSYALYRCENCGGSRQY